MPFDPRIFKFTDNSTKYIVDENQPISISVPKHYNKKPNDSSKTNQVNSFGVGPAHVNYIAEVTLKDGGPTGANCSQITEASPIHSTNIQTAGHITLSKRPTVLEILKGKEMKLSPALLLTVEPVEYSAEKFPNTNYPPAQDGDYVVTPDAIKNQLERLRHPLNTKDVIPALAIRVDHDNYLKTPFNTFNNPAYFLPEAIKYIEEQDITIMLTNLPALSRAADNGLLDCERILHGLPENKDPSCLYNEKGELQDEGNKTSIQNAFFGTKESLPDGFYFFKANAQHNVNLPDANAAPVFYNAIKTP